MLSTGIRLLTLSFRRSYVNTEPLFGPRSKASDSTPIDVSKSSDSEGEDEPAPKAARRCSKVPGSHWLLLGVMRTAATGRVVGFELDLARPDATSVHATSTAMLARWGVTEVKAGWEQAMPAFLEEEEVERVPVPTLQLTEDKTECGTWVALLAHMVACVRGGRVDARTAVGNLDGLRGSVRSFRAHMLGACRLNSCEVR